MKKLSTLSKNVFFYSTIALILMAFVSLAQELPKIEYIKTDHSTTDWYLESRKPNPNYYKVQKLYNDFFKAHPLEKSPQRSIILRWLQVNRNYLDASGNVVIAPVPAEETQRLMRANKPQANARQGTATSPYPAWNDMTGTWRMIGPYHGKDKGCANQPTMSGGFNDRVYINPYNTQNLYAGQSYGGLWVSQDQGATWKLTDAEFPNGKNTYSNRDVYYGDIKVSKTNASLVFAATEAGLLKSTNAGNSWSLVNGLNYVEKPTERAYFVAPSNHDANMLLASYGQKIYRTTNGGSTWTVVFNNVAGGANYSQEQHSTNGVSGRKYNFAGLSFHPTNNNVVYLAAREATTNRITIQVSIDYGQTWSVLIPGSRVVNGVTQTTTDGPVKMEIVPSAPNKIYLLNVFQDLGSSTTIGTTKGIVKYSTAGDLVQATPYPVTGHLLDDCTVSVTDSTVMYLGGYASGEVHKSTNGGLTFFTNNPGGGCVNFVHSDVRCLYTVGNLLLIASDGGNHISKDGMTTIQPTGKWISAIDLWGFSSAFKGDVVATGDDHGPTEVRWFDGDSGWEHDGGADSKDITINPAQPRWIYAMDVYRKYRMVTKEAAYDKAYGIDSSSVSALKYHAVHPNIYGKSYPIQENNLLVSNDNMATIAGTLYRFPGIITRVKQPLRNPAIFYVLVNSRDIYKSINGGSSFSSITPNTTVTGGNTNVTDIEVSQDGSVVWLSYGQVQTTCKVIKSTNGGATWVNYSTGLPSPTISNITMQRGTNGGIYVSTDGGGVWYRDNTMGNWALLGTGLPMMGYVRSAYVVPNRKAYRMGTARGAFEHELAFNTTADALISVDRNGAVTCRDTLFFRDYSAYQGTTNVRYAWTFAGGTPATSTQENPGVTYASPGVYDVSLTVTDANNVSSTHTLTNFISVSAATETQLYVRAGATGANTGADWTNAFTDLQSALNTCSSSLTAIRVAAGIYKPTSTTDRTVSFAMKDGVTITGGFAGTGASPDARTPLSTTLSGNIGDPNSTTDNSYHVFNNPTGLTNTAILDGFVITGGNANSGSTLPHIAGGAMYNDGSSPSLRNCQFLLNSASTSGGGLFNSNSSPVMTNCSFQSNSSSYSGGAIQNQYSSSPRFTNCSFQGNSAPNGGAIISFGSTPSLTNSVFWNNGDGTTFYNDNSSTVAASYSLFDASVTGYTSGPGNLTVTTSPFGSTTSTQLAACSPAINAGSNIAFNATGLTTDIVGNTRPYAGGVVDMGAYEFNSPLPTPTSLSTGTPTATSVTATWTMTPATAPTEIQWRAIGTTAWSSATVATGVSSYSITGLTVETTYEWQVRPNCPATPNYISGNNFSTSPYCRPTYSNGCNVGDALTSFSLNNVPLSQSSGCSAGSFTYVATNRQVASGQPITCSGTFSSNSSEGVAIWADLNRNNVFESNEIMYQRGATSGPFSGTLTIPAGTATGALRIRVLVAFSTTPVNSCGNYGYGETEDYLITVTSGTTCTAMTTTKAGTWDDPTVWSCNRVPTSTDAVTVGHTVAVPAGATVNVLKISYGTGGKLSFGTGSKVRLGL